MASEYVPVDISEAPELQKLAEAVRRTGKPHALKQGAETVAVVRPAPKRERGAVPSRRRDRHFTMNDSLWNMCGVVDGPGPTDVAANKDKYLAQAYTSKPT